MSQAATISGYGRSNVSKLASRGEITSNDKTGRECRIFGASLVQHMLANASDEDKAETDEAVNRKFG